MWPRPPPAHTPTPGCKAAASTSSLWLFSRLVKEPQVGSECCSQDQLRPRPCPDWRVSRPRPDQDFTCQRKITTQQKSPAGSKVEGAGPGGGRGAPDSRSLSQTLLSWVFFFAFEKLLKHWRGRSSQRCSCCTSKTTSQPPSMPLSGGVGGGDKSCFLPFLLLM